MSCRLKFRSDAKAAITGLSSAAPVALWDKTDNMGHFVSSRELVPSMLTPLCEWSSWLREGLCGLKMLLRISWTLWSWPSLSQKSQHYLCWKLHFEDLDSLRCYPAETATSGYVILFKMWGEGKDSTETRQRPIKISVLPKVPLPTHTRENKKENFLKTPKPLESLQELEFLTLGFCGFEWEINIKWLWNRNLHYNWLRLGRDSLKSYISKIFCISS